LQAEGHWFETGILHQVEGEAVNEEQRKFVKAILNIVFTIIFAGMAAGKLFALELELVRYVFASISLLIILVVGGVIQRGVK